MTNRAPLKSELRSLDIPARVKALPRDHRGFPIPAFVYVDRNGDADFRVVKPGFVEHCRRFDRCWICGNKLARHKVFVIGPMCAINRVSSEPPMHRSCAIFSAQACPFLTKPRMRRNEVGLPEDRVDAPGIALAHNPGAVCLWFARDYQMIAVDNGLLFQLGEPEDVRWITEGRTASRREVIEALKRGLPSLLDVARSEGDDAMRALFKQIVAVRPYLPQPAANEADEEEVLMR